MGQTQVLLMVLVVIIVGISLATGITMFGGSATASNRDAVVQDCQTIASYSQQYYKKPSEMGGGARTFTGLTLAKLDWLSSNNNGSYTLTVTDAQNISIGGTGVESGVSCTLPVNGTTGIGVPTITP
jgi:Tfp pilus assembly protein PilE